MADNPSADENVISPAIESADLAYPLDENERPSEAVVRAVASLTDTKVIDLDPLYQTAEPAHLNGLFDESKESHLLANSLVAFEYNECTVTVTQNTVYVCRGANDDTPSEH